MKNNYIYKITALLLALIVFNSCEKEDWTYTGKQLYEFSAQKNRQEVRSNLLFKENSRIGLDSVCIQIIKPSDAEIVVNYEIITKVYYLKDKDRYVSEVPAGTEARWIDTLDTDAVYGTDYEILNSAGSTFDAASKKGSVTIPKGGFFAYIQVDLKVKSGTQFFIKLTDSKDAMANKPTGLFNYVIAPDKVFYLDESFLTGLPSTWSTIDKDGDGYDWNFYKGAMTSDSYSGGPLYPENYLVSPKVVIPNRVNNVSLTFEVASGAKSVWEEQYRVLASEEPITFDNCREAQVVSDWTELPEITKNKNYIMETVDFTAFKGKTIYIAFLHGNCSDIYYINLRNVKLFSH